MCLLPGLVQVILTAFCSEVYVSKNLFRVCLSGRGAFFSQMNKRLVGMGERQMTAVGSTTTAPVGSASAMSTGETLRALTSTFFSHSSVIGQ